MKCSNCGLEILEGSNFCTNCGIRISNNIKKNSNFYLYIETIGILFYVLAFVFFIIYIPYFKIEGLFSNLSFSLTLFFYGTISISFGEIIKKINN